MSFMRNKYVVRGVLLLLMVVLIGGIAWYFMFSSPKDPSETFRDEFELVLQRYDGSEVSLSEFRRGALIAYAWASWCVYCKEEFQNLAKLKEKYGDKIQVLAVNRAEPLPIAKAYTDSLQGVTGITYLIDPEDAFFKSVGGYAMPETIFIKSSGDVFFQQRGPMTLEEAESKLQELLK